MSSWAIQFINGISLLLGFWLGAHLSQRHKGWPLMAIVYGFSIISLSDYLLLPHAYIYPGSRHNNLSGYLAMMASSMLFVTGAVLIKDATIALWKAYLSKRNGRNATGSQNAAH